MLDDRRVVPHALWFHKAVELARTKVLLVLLLQYFGLSESGIGFVVRILARINE